MIDAASGHPEVDAFKCNALFGVRVHRNARLVGRRATQPQCNPALSTLKYTRPRVEFHSAKANKEESEQRGRSVMTNVVFVCVMGVAF